MVSFVAGSVFDVLVVVLTMCRTARVIMRSNIRKGYMGKNVVFILFRDGKFYACESKKSVLTNKSLGLAYYAFVFFLSGIRLYSLLILVFLVLSSDLHLP